MKEGYEIVLKAAQANPEIYKDLLANPVVTAASLGASLTREDVAALRAMKRDIAAHAREHDREQARSEKHCVFVPVFGALPKRGPAKVPKPRKKKRKSP